MDDRALTIDLCERLGAITGWVWSATSSTPYTKDLVGVRYGRIPATPDLACGVRVYGGTDDDETVSKTRTVQLRSRGAPNRPDGADVIADAAHALLKSLVREGVISSVTRLSFTPLGADASQREERTDNYLIDFDNPEASS